MSASFEVLPSLALMAWLPNVLPGDFVGTFYSLCDESEHPMNSKVLKFILHRCLVSCFGMLSNYAGLPFTQAPNKYSDCGDYGDSQNSHVLSDRIWFENYLVQLGLHMLQRGKHPSYTRGGNSAHSDYRDVLAEQGDLLQVGFATTSRFERRSLAI